MTKLDNAIKTEIVAIGVCLLAMLSVLGLAFVCYLKGAL